MPDPANPATEPLFGSPLCPQCGFEECWWSTVDEDGCREYVCDRCKAHGRYGNAK